MTRCSFAQHLAAVRSCAGQQHLLLPSSEMDTATPLDTAVDRILASCRGEEITWELPQRLKVAFMSFCLPAVSGSGCAVFCWRFPHAPAFRFAVGRPARRLGAAENRTR